MKIAIVDDNELELALYSDKLKHAFSEKRVSFTISSYKNGEQLIDNISDYDITFLDIEMPELDGLTLAKQLKQLKPTIIVIFISEHDSYVWNSFSVEAVYFLRKKHFDVEIDSAINQIIKSYEKYKKDNIVIESGKNIHKFRVSEIIYIEAQKKKTKIVTANEEIELKQGFLYIEKILKSCGFIKVHRSYLLNHKYIKNIGNNYVLLDNEIIVPLSKYRAKEVKDLYYCMLGE